MSKLMAMLPLTNHQSILVEAEILLAIQTQNKIEKLKFRICFRKKSKDISTICINK